MKRFKERRNMKVYGMSGEGDIIGLSRKDGRETEV